MEHKISVQRKPNEKTLIVYYIGGSKDDIEALLFFLEYGVRHGEQSKDIYIYVFVFDESHGSLIEPIIDSCHHLSGKSIFKCKTCIPNNRDTLSGWNFGLRYILTNKVKDGKKTISFSQYDFYVFISSFASGPFFPWWAYGRHNENDDNIVPDWCQLYVNLLTQSPIDSTEGFADCVVPTINETGVISTEVVITRPEMVAKWMNNKDVVIFDSSTQKLYDQSSRMEERWKLFSHMNGKIKSMLMLDEKSKVYSLAGHHPYETLFTQRVSLPGITPEKIFKINEIYVKLYSNWHSHSNEWEGISCYGDTKDKLSNTSKKVLVLWTHHEINRCFEMFLNRGLVDDPNYTFIFIINLMNRSKMEEIKTQLERVKDLLRQVVHAKIHIIFYGPPVNGLDFGAWSYALLAWGPKNGVKWTDFDYIIMLNGSISGPYYPKWWYLSKFSYHVIPDWISLVTSKISDGTPFHIIGITVNTKAVVGRNKTGPALQSMFMCYKRESLRDAINIGIFLYPFPYKSKYSIICQHEIKLSYRLSVENPGTSKLRFTDMLAFNRYAQRLEADPVKRKVRFLCRNSLFSFTGGLRYIHPFETLFFKHHKDDKGEGGTSDLDWGY